MALKRYDEVLGSCDAYLASEQPTVEILEIRGLARLARQDYSGAIADYTRALESAARPGPRRPGPGCSTSAAGPTTSPMPPGWPSSDFEASLKLDQGPERRPRRPGPGPDPPGRVASGKDIVKSRQLRLADDPKRIEAIADSHDALADLEKRMEDAFEREILELAMRRVESRVKPTTWQAFRLTAIENRPGVEAAKELRMQVAHVFVAKHRVQKMLEEVRKLQEERG